MHLERALLSGADLHKLQTLQEEETHPYTRTCTPEEFLLFPVLNIGHCQVLRFFLIGIVTFKFFVTFLSWFFRHAMLIFVSPTCHKVVNLLNE